MSEKLAEPLKRLVLMEADLARLLEIQSEIEEQQTPLDAEAGLRIVSEISARLVANQRQIVELLILFAEELSSAPRA